tara:strand:- start:1 stop:678 length:678 start_codon:yes stop_codon:yes gene_type:complete
MNTNETILENLKYGNLTFEQEEQLKTDKSVFTNYVDFFTNEPYPNVSSTTTEINELNKLMNDKSESKNWDEVKELITHTDVNSFGILEMYITDLGIDFKSDYLKKVQLKLRPFILSLKKHYNRPRPYQFSYYTKQGLHPFKSKTAHTPSYPSGHSLQNYFLCRVVAHHNPDKKNEIMEVADIIAKTREVLGVHYKSDNLFSKYIVDELVKVKEIKDIYFNEKKLG